MRLFLAIELPEEVRRHLERVRSKFQYPRDVALSVSWVKPENWHVTMKFLGDVEDPRVPELTGALSRVRGDMMHLVADRMLYFPKHGPVHVVGVGVGGDAGRLAQLQARIEAICSDIGFMKEAREFKGHITLGRSKHGQRDEGLGSLRGMTLEKLFPGPPFDVSEFVLMHSQLHPEGSRYTPVARFKFC